jgi:hypothetical protein
VVVLVVLLLSTTWCIPHLGVSCADLKANSIGATACNTNNSNSSSNNSSSSTVLLLHPCSRLPSGHYSSFSPATSLASNVGRWGTLLVNAACPSNTTHYELRHPWSTSRGTQHHELAMPTTPPWMRSRQEQKC